MASGSLVGQSDAREQQEKGYSRKNQRKSKNPKSVPYRYYQEQYSQKILVNTTDDNIPGASDDSSSQPGSHNCREPSHGNAIPGYAKFDSFVKISFDLSNREEARALKRKLASELDQVMSLLRRLETTQIQLSKTVNRNAATISVNKNGNSHGSESVEKVTMAPKMNQFYQNLEVVGSEKLGTLEGNKKLKSNHNIKGNSFVSNKDFSRLFKSCRNLLERLMKHKYGWVFNKPVDVKGLGLHDYYTIIKHPMDLGTVKHRLSKNLYKSPTEFAEDVRLTFSNAMLYNPKGQDVHIMAEGLYKIFEETWTKLEAEHNCSGPLKTGRDSSLASRSPKKVPANPAPVRTPAHLAPVRTPAPASPAPVRTPASPPPAPVRTPAPPPPPPAPVHTTSPARPPPAPVRTTTPAPPAPVYSPAPCPRPLKMRTLERVESVTMPEDLKTKATNLAHQERTQVLKKPKAKSPDKMDMTYEEKHRLSLNLQELPSDKLDNVVQIIKKRNPVLSQQDDEIEVDIDSFDPETLWELDRFVTNYKKSLSRNKGNAEVAHQATAEAEHNIQERNMEPLIAEAPKETEAVVEKIVSTSLPVLEEKHGHNANESSSSSGSSSDSGPSSIGSDSGSSSGYHSPADDQTMR